MAARPISTTKTKQAPAFTNLTNLASERLGTEIIFATDEWFAVAEMMLTQSDPLWNEEFTEYGKWMDGWETRRKRVAGHDWCIVKLGIPGKIHGVDIDTSYFTGNNVPRASIQGAYFPEGEEPYQIKVLHDNRKNPNLDAGKLGTKASDKDFELANTLMDHTWTEIVPFTPLGPGYEDTCHTYVPVKSDKIFTHIRLNMFPDGGIARLRIFGDVKLDLERIPNNKTFDLLAVENGGKALGCTNAHYGHPKNIIMPGNGINMGDGWETARNPDRPPVFKMGNDGLIQLKGSDFSVLKLACPSRIENIMVSTNHFKGNFPESCFIEGCNLPESSSDELVFKDTVADRIQWFPLLPRTKLSATSDHHFQMDQLANLDKIFTHVRLTIYPDGGIMRLRIYGNKAIKASRL